MSEFVWSLTPELLAQSNSTALLWTHRLPRPRCSGVAKRRQQANPNDDRPRLTAAVEK